MNVEVKKRLGWIRVYEGNRNFGQACLRCGISRPTLRRWWRRYESDGIKGLVSRSRRPRRMPFQKVFSSQTKLIQRLRQKNFGARRIQSELIRHHEFHLSLATIHKTLKRLKVGPLVRLKRKRSQFKRYSRPIPGDRVKMDTCKIGKGFYQYTAVDDCTRYKVVALFPKRTAANTLNFLEQVVNDRVIPFFDEHEVSLIRILTDRGTEYCGKPDTHDYQLFLALNDIDHTKTKTKHPQTNDICERFHKTILNEFYSIALRKKIYLTVEELEKDLDAWLDRYNSQRPHQGKRCQGKTPMQTFTDNLLAAREKMWNMESVQTRF